MKAELRVYASDMIKRTNINLDSVLLSQAATVLGTERITDTVHAAMREVVAQHHRRRLAERDLFEGVSSDDLEQMRRGRGPAA